MSSNLFENAKFNFGWELPIEIQLFGKVYPAIASADSYFLTEKATDEQSNSYKSFLENSNEILKTVETTLIYEAGTTEGASKRFIPRLVKIERNGDYGIVFDDKDDSEGGLVVAIKPAFQIINPDAYF